MGKVIITEQNDRVLLFLMDESGQPQMIQAAFCEEGENIGSIYIGRVTEVAAGIQAAFVSISSNGKVFLPFSECTGPFLTNRSFDGKLRQGDELLVQVTSKALKSKLPQASARLSLTGKYCVCKMGGHDIACSGKLDKNTAGRIRKAIKEREITGRKNYSFIIRTNAGTLEDLLPLFEEMEKFISIFEEIQNKYASRIYHTCLYRSEPEWAETLKGIPQEDYSEILTDSRNIYDHLRTVSGSNIRFYQDPQISLKALYSLETHLKRALDQKVWLPSGGYLVIEPTEAMVVIDVNSGKASGGKGAEKKKLYLQTNLEASREIARQLRLRNDSGMIMVDFINLESGQEEQILMKALAEELQKDKVKTRLVDMTPLGIVEITRKKVSRPLRDFFARNLSF